MSDSLTQARRSARGLLGDRFRLLIVLLIGVILVMSQVSEFFLTRSNLVSMTRFSVVIGLLAIGQALVILGGGGGIDLSVGSTLSLCAIVMGYLCDSLGLNPWIAALIAIAGGALLGSINGALVAGVGVPPLIATLATLYLYGALANVISGGSQFGNFDRTHFASLGQGTLLGIPLQVVLLIVVATIVLVSVDRSGWGRGTYLVGNSASAAWLAGWSPVKTRISLYVLSGMLAGMAAVVNNAWLLTAKPSAGKGLELQAITIAVLGGIDIFGGRGRLRGVLVALAIVTVLSNGLQLASVGNSIQIGILGAVLIGAVLVNNATAS